VDVQALLPRLAGFARHAYGVDAEVRDLRRLPGHSGLNYRFEIYSAAHRGLIDRLVIRLSPRPGPARGNIDMVRQAQLLQGVGRCGVPVPEVRWYGDDPRWFGVAYHMTGLIGGRPFQDWDPDPSFDLSAGGIQKIYRQAVDVLADIHQIPVTRLPIAQEAPRSVVDELAHWEGVADHAVTDQWRDGVNKIRELLIAQAPTAWRTGLVHGDFRAGNLLFDQDRLTAVLDWEVSSIGPQLLDLAWLLFFLNSRCWYGSGPAHADQIADDLTERYKERTGDPLNGLTWFSALALYRYIAIILFNHMLHKTGKRADTLWEQMIQCVPALIGQAQRMLTSSPASG
jgi:aminoglycoside phosphotransferase (APT) family kinase protein